MVSCEHPSRACIVIDRTDHGVSVVLEETQRQGAAEVLDGTQLTEDVARRFGPGERVLITSENVLDPVLQRLDDPGRAALIRSLKDKHRCREMMAAHYPDLFFRRVALDRLEELDLPAGRRFVVKPNRGYFATAVKIVDADSDLAAVRDAIAAEVARNAAVFAPSVLSDADVVVEEFIDGEEYAVDMFFDGAGKPVIVNLYHHPIPENPDYLHALYYTSKPVFDALHDRLIDWFAVLNETLGARDFPIHGEFRLGSKGLVPIELNPLRFGGDGLAELAYHAFGINPYIAFATGTAPDWPTLWRGREDRIYTWMMGYVGSEVDVASHRPNIGAFQSLFANILSDTLLNYEAHLGFSVVYSEERDMDRVHRLVNTDFQRFFQGSEAYSDDALDALYRAGVRVAWPAGMRVWEEGDIGDFILLVMEGALEVRHGAPDGAEILLDSVGPRSVVGEFAVIDGRPRSAGVRAGPDGCVAMRVTGPAFRKLLREAPGLFEELYWQQQIRIRKMNRRLGELEAELRALRRNR
jgi:CRP-like cAMP-binding protein